MKKAFLFQVPQCLPGGAYGASIGADGREFHKKLQQITQHIVLLFTLFVCSFSALTPSKVKIARQSVILVINFK